MQSGRALEAKMTLMFWVGKADILRRDMAVGVLELSFKGTASASKPAIILI
jgi:hypothetical protein